MFNKELIDPKLADVEAWDRLIKSPDFCKLEEFIEYRKTVLYKEIKFLGDTANQDNAIKILTLLARISELETLFKKVEFKKSEKRKMEEQQNG